MREWLSNYWYHYKVHTIVVIFVIILIVYTVVEINNRTVTDLDVMVAGRDTLISSNIDQFEAETQNLMQDANGDGKVVCTVNNVVVDEENANVELNGQYLEKLTLTIVTGDTKLYLVNQEMLEYLEDKNVCQDITDVYEKMNLPHEGEQYYYKTSTSNPVLQPLRLQEGEYYVFVRIRNSAIRDTEEQDIQYQNAYHVLEKIMSEDIEASQE